MRFDRIALVFHSLQKIIAAIAISLMLAAAALIATSIIGRLMFNMPIFGADELSILLLHWIAMLGLPLMFFEKTSVGAVLFDRSAKVAIGAQILVLLLLAACGAELVRMQVMMQARSPVFEISQAWSTLALPIGCVLSIVVLARVLLARPAPRQ